MKNLSSLNRDKRDAWKDRNDRKKSRKLTSPWILSSAFRSRRNKSQDVRKRRRRKRKCWTNQERKLYLQHGLERKHCVLKCKHRHTFTYKYGLHQSMLFWPVATWACGLFTLTEEWLEEALDARERTDPWTTTKKTHQSIFAAFSNGYFFHQWLTSRIWINTHDKSAVSPVSA